ncbi:hypothetical protein COOONC_22046 [Cooperia oncophora]
MGIAFRTGGLLTGIVHLVALAFAHYLQIRRPFDHQKILSLRTVQVVIFFIWAVPPLSLIIYFSSWPGQGFSALNQFKQLNVHVSEFQLSTAELRLLKRKQKRIAILDLFVMPSKLFVNHDRVA